MTGQRGKRTRSSPSSIYRGLVPKHFNVEHLDEGADDDDIDGASDHNHGCSSQELRGLIATVVGHCGESS